MSEAAASEDDLLARLRARLDPLNAPAQPPLRSDFDLNPHARPIEPRQLRPAAVLAPLVRRPHGWTLLLTKRTEDMPTHAGQIAFPGGRLQAEDASAVDAALRETEEEIGVARRFLEPLGQVEAYETVTGFHVTPIVALVHPGFELRPDPREVAEVFETPLEFLMDPANHQRHEREWNGMQRAYYVMPYRDRFIWGATAGMIKALYDRLYGPARP